MKRVVDIQKLRVVETPSRREPDERFEADVLVIGGGLGGVAAALAAGQAGRTVCLTEETDWLGGQATSQGVSALDENRYIETSGGTRRYLAFREAIRQWYRDHTALKPAFAAEERLNPGRGWVSRLCFEPKAAVAVIDAMLAPLIERGRLRVLTRRKAFGVTMEDRRVRGVDCVHLDGGRTCRLSGKIVIDATELGDLLALGAAQWITGAESRAQTGEPSAIDEHDPEDIQSFTYPFAVEHRPGEVHAIGKPPRYERNRDEQPYTLTLTYATRGDITYGMFARLERTYGSFWHYRRLIDASQFEDPAYANDIAMINWPGNDYRGGDILVESPSEQIEQLRAAKHLSLGLLYWLQHEVERDEGGSGYPEFMLRPDVMDGADGLSKYPYIRESRRILALKTILEQEVTTETIRAAHFPDSVGIGLYAIDLHESKRNRKQIISPTRPFQIPLGALIPRTTANLLAGCKNIGTTHITNGCYRLHPIEWGIGEAAGETAALCIEEGLTPAQVRADGEKLHTLQRRLVRRGAPVMWYDDVGVDDPAFEHVQMLPFESPEVLARLQENLHAPK